MGRVTGPPPFVTATERLYLRPIELSDSAPTAALITPSISRWLATWPEHISREEAAARIALLQEQSALGLVFARAIQHGDGSFMGWIVARKDHAASRTGKLGYWMGEPFHGHGYMSEAAAAFVPLAWPALAIDTLEAGVQPANMASIATLKRLGMHYAGEREELVPARNRMELSAWYILSRS